MKLSVYVPKDLEGSLRSRARSEGLSPALYVQAVVRDDLEGSSSRWPDDFLALAGSWEDDRSTDEIIRDIEESRVSAERDELR